MKKDKKSDKIVYIAGPYRHDRVHGIYDNIHSARKLAEKYWVLGYTVICPHLNSAFMDGLIPDSEWLKRDLNIMRKCDMVVMAPGWENSNGAIKEMREAKRLGIPIIIDIEQAGLA